MKAFDTLKDALRASDFAGNQPFELIRQISLYLSHDDEERQTEGQELLIRLLERRNELNGYEPLISALIRDCGLFPYADPQHLSPSDLLAYEFHRPDPSSPREYVFHRVQAEVFHKLAAGKNLILSAPTSFGKSAIIEELIISGRYKTIVIVMPTIALIDETRKKLHRYNEHYKLITHNDQKRDDERGNIYLLTQERAIDRDDLANGVIDLLVIDEFYKLDPNRGDNRFLSLNHALYKLLKRAKQFYMLGPGIRNLSFDPRVRLKADLLVTDYATVATDVHQLSLDETEYQPKLVELIARLMSQNEPTIVYCKSPQSAGKVCAALLEAGLDFGNQYLKGFHEWLCEHYNFEWVFTRGIARGIGLHHGKLPRSLSQTSVRYFNTGKLPLLICTSTLIEGVNTSAKNVVIFDNKIAQDAIDFFTFNNIKGRSGRMFKHFIGQVFVFGTPPDRELFDVDIPAISGGDSAPDGLLLQMDDDDLSPESKQRVSAFGNQNIIGLEVLRKNAHVLEPGEQIVLARHIADNLREQHNLLCWRQHPNRDQLKHVCDLMESYMNLFPPRRGGVRSTKQLAYFLWRLSIHKNTENFVREAIERRRDSDTIDATIELAFEFIRNWAAFNFPSKLMALDLIQKDIFMRHGLDHGDYAYYASAAENLFMNPAITALDEYGVPSELVLKLPGAAKLEGTDNAIDFIRSLDARTHAHLTPFENELLKVAQDSL